MKAIGSIMLALLVTSLVVKCQSVTFSGQRYEVGQTVKATVSGGLTGIENDISKSSGAAKDGVLVLGIPNEAKFYRINFKFLAGEKSYLLAVPPRGSASVEPLVFELTPQTTLTAPADLQNRMLRYFQNASKAELLQVTKVGLQTFCTKNAVSLVANAAFCITTASGGVVVLPICRSLSSDNLKEFSRELSLAFFTEMKRKNAISEAELKTLTRYVQAMDVVGMLKSNCSILFQSLGNLSNNADVKIALGYFEQQCKTTVLIIEKFTPL